jgi:hypothetical protein
MEKELLKEIAIQHLREAYCRFGIEGTEDVIKEIYKEHSEVREYLLKTHQELIRA